MVERPNPSQWNVAGHRGAVRVRYKVFGDHLNGTHLAIDSTHAHLNMPPSLMWARGLESRPARVTFEAPAEMEDRDAAASHTGSQNVHGGQPPISDR